MGSGRITWVVLALLGGGHVGCAAPAPEGDEIVPETGCLESDPAAPGTVLDATLGEVALALEAADGTRWEFRDGEDLEAWLASTTARLPSAGQLTLRARADQEFRRLQRVLRVLREAGHRDVALKLGAGPSPDG